MPRDPQATGSARRRLVRGAIAALLVLAGCGPPPSRPPDADWPAGALLSAQRSSLVHLLGQLESLDRTPLSRSARALRLALPDCEHIEARAPEGASGLVDALRCAAEDGGLQALHRDRGEDAILLALPIGEGPRLVVRVHDQRDRLRVGVLWPEAAATGIVASLLPGEDAAGPAVLGGDPILHARARSPGLDLAALVPEGSQGDELFRLRNGLLSSALLDGTWEIAVYPPAEGTAMPRMAAALGVRLRTAAEVAVQRLLGDLETTWSLSHAPLRWDGAEGACLTQLRLLPELAPCVIATERALVFGWNLESLRQALDAERIPAAGTATAARAELDLVRLRAADLQLAALRGGDVLSQVTRWPWQSVVARGERRGGSIAWEIELRPAAGTES